VLFGFFFTSSVGHYKKVTFYFVKKRCEGNKRNKSIITPCTLRYSLCLQVPGPGRHVQKKILNINVLLIHVSETYNTIMSLHVLGISVDVHIELFDNSLLK
jgi:hypothetical protein